MTNICSTRQCLESPNGCLYSRQPGCQTGARPGTRTTLPFGAESSAPGSRFRTPWNRRGTLPIITLAGKCPSPETRPRRQQVTWDRLRPAQCQHQFTDLSGSTEPSVCTECNKVKLLVWNFGCKSPSSSATRSLVSFSPLQTGLNSVDKSNSAVKLYL